jgi:hypothetical protein
MVMRSLTMQFSGPSPLALARGEQLLLPEGLETDPKLVDRTEEFE